MRWGAFALALALTYLAQSSVLFLFGWEWLDLFLVLALLCGLAAPTNEARLAGWLIGLVQDLGSIDALGLHAFSLGLAAWAITVLREEFNVYALLPRLIVLWCGAFSGTAACGLHRMLWSGGGGSWSGALGAALLSATAAAFVVVAIAAAPGFARRRRMSVVRRA